MVLNLLLALCLVPQAGDPVDEALRSFATAFRSREIKTRAAAVTTLARTQDQKVLNKLGPLLKHRDREIRLAAAGGLRTWTGTIKGNVAKQFSRALASGTNRRDGEVQIAILSGLASLKVESSASAVEKLFDADDPAVAKAAVAAAGAIRSKKSVSPLISLLQYLEKVSKPLPAPKPPLAGGYGKTITRPAPTESKSAREKRARATTVLPSVRGALQAITGQTTLKTGRDWSAWWSRNRSSFKPVP